MKITEKCKQVHESTTNLCNPALILGESQGKFPQNAFLETLMVDNNATALTQQLLELYQDSWPGVIPTTGKEGEVIGGSTLTVNNV